VLGLDANECERHSHMLASGLIAGAQAHGCASLLAVFSCVNRTQSSFLPCWCRWKPHRPLGDVAAAPHIVALSHPNLVASEVVQQLQYDHGIVCSSRAGAVRVSLAPYNDETDVVALLDALGTM
jgi:selenocysteine lyase/cysteine desulfurase